MNILLLGSYGRKNLGDDIYLKILLDKLSQHNISFNCWNVDSLPKDIILSENMKYFSTKIFKDLYKKLITFHKSEIIIYGGGELWMRLNLNYCKNSTLYRMLIVNLLAKLWGKKIYYISVGSEPLKGWSLFLARRSAALADFVIFRDKQSANSIPIPKKNYTIAPDLAYLLDVDQKTNKTKKKYIAVNALYDVGGYDYFKKYVKDMADIVSSLKQEVVFIPGHQDPEYIHNDIWVSNKIISAGNISNSSILSYNKITHFIQLIKNCDYTISSRLHICIVSELCEIPVLGIVYKPKVKKYFNEIKASQAAIPISRLQIKEDSLAFVRDPNVKQQIKTGKNFRIRKAQNVYRNFFDRLESNNR